MIDQSFSVNNFKAIFEKENSKGVYLENTFFPSVEVQTRKLKGVRIGFRNLKKKEKSGVLSTREYEYRKESLNNLKAKIREEREKRIVAELKVISDQASRFDFKTELEKLEIPGSDKEIYSLNNTPCTYFVNKQVQWNLKNIFKVKQANRSLIVSQLEKILGDRFPKIVIRTDIRNFYETISHELLHKKIDSQPLLSASSKKVIKNIIKHYKILSNEDRGLPRGLGVSAYLAELYMKAFDQAIENEPSLIYYARYVDDIVAIFTTKSSDDKERYLGFIRSQAVSLGLELHTPNPGSGKTIIHDLSQPKNVNFEFLGYKFSYGSSQVKISMSGERFKRYRERIDLACNEYLYKSRFNEKRERKIFVKRMKFLTGNTRLLNNKNNALVGSYFSNSKVNDMREFKRLDAYLQCKTAAKFPRALVNRLDELSFESGFENKTFHNFTVKDLTKIVAVWKNV